LTRSRVPGQVVEKMTVKCQSPILAFWYGNDPVQGTRSSYRASQPRSLWLERVFWRHTWLLGHPVRLLVPSVPR